MDANNHIKNLIVLACADGRILDSELGIIAQKAIDSGISLDELESWLNNAHELVLDIPKVEEEREKHLIDMINLGLADGRFCQSEYDLCKMMVEKLPYAHLKESLFFTMRKAKLTQLVNKAAQKGLTRQDQEMLNRAARNAGISVDELANLLSGDKTSKKKDDGFFKKPLSRCPVKREVPVFYKTSN